MGELDELINQQVEDELRDLEEKPQRRVYDQRIKADAKAIANYNALPRPLKPPGRS